MKIDIKEISTTDEVDTQKISSKLGCYAHNKQYDIWEKEHIAPFMFPFVASSTPNPGVVEFYSWLKNHYPVDATLSGLEICCGKGRNAIWLASRMIKMSAFDFSPVAITTAKNRQKILELPSKVNFLVSDAVTHWSYPDNSFDFVIDCFGSADIESEIGRKNVLDEAWRVLKPNGYYFLQIDSPECGFFAERMKTAPGEEANTLVFPNGKIEAVLTENDIKNWKHKLQLIEVRREIETSLEIFGQTAPYKYFWIIAQAGKK